MRLSDPESGRSLFSEDENVWMTVIDFGEESDWIVSFAGPASQTRDLVFRCDWDGRERGHSLAEAAHEATPEQRVCGALEYVRIGHRIEILEHDRGYLLRPADLRPTFFRPCPRNDR